jgi:lipopolysaccharide exporter
LRFGALAVLNLISSLAMTIGAPLLAFLGAGVWSLVFEQVVGYLVRWVGLWVVVRPWRPVLGFDWREAKSLIGFGQQVLLSQFLGITLDRFDDFWAGTALGATALGYYSRAYEIARYPARVLATPVTHVFFATYAALQEDRPGLSKAFFRSSSFLVRAGFLLAIVLLVVIPELTLVLLGEAWLPIVPIFRLMMVYVVMDPLYLNLSYLVIGLGHPDLLVRVRLLLVLLFVGTVLIFVRWWDIRGLAFAADMMILSGVALLLFFSTRFVDLWLSKMLGWPTLALALSAVAGVGLTYALQGSSRWLAMMVEAAGVALTYVIVLGAAEPDTLSEYVGWIQRTYSGIASGEGEK